MTKEQNNSPEDFLAALAEPSPSPAAGSAAAYAAAMAAALVVKVCRITLAKNQASVALVDLSQAAAARQGDLTRLAEEDRTAVAAHFQLRKDKGGNAERLLAEMRPRFTLIPLEIGEKAAAVGELAAEARELVWSGVRDDNVAAVLLAAAAARAAAGLVRANLRFLPEAPWKRDVAGRLAVLVDRLG